MIPPATLFLVALLPSGGLDVPDSLRPHVGFEPGIPWHGLAKGMMATGAVAGLVVAPLAVTVQAFERGEDDWNCTKGDSAACAAAREPLPSWPGYLFPAGLGLLAGGFLLHLFTLDDSREHMKVFATSRRDGMGLGWAWTF